MRNFDNITATKPDFPTAPEASPQRDNSLSIRELETGTGKFYHPENSNERIPEELFEMA